MRILVVEDERAIWEAFEPILRRRGHDPHYAPSVKYALDFLLSDTYDVVLLDWELGDDPDGGRRVLVRVPRGTHVILTSGHSPDAIRERNMRDPMIGVDRYVGKPFNFLELVKEIEGMIVS